MSVNGAAFVSHKHLQNEIWTAVDGYTVSHLHPQSKHNSATLLHALRHSVERGLPDIASYPTIGKFYALQCKALRVKHALELGTLGGYTSIWLASENPKLQITTIEVDPHHAKIAQENLEHAGVANRVTIRLGAGLDVIPQLSREIAAGERPKLGFVYIDADKENNWAYLDQVIGICEPGAVIFVDNIVRGGKLVNPDFSEEKGVIGAKRVVENVGKDPRVEGTVLQTVGEKSYDGILMAVVN